MAERRKPFKVKIKYEAAAEKRETNKAGHVIGNVVKTILKVLMTLMLIGVITGALVLGVTAVYVMQDVNVEASLDLANIDYNYTTIIYGVDDNNKPVEVQRIYANGENRVWVNLDQIPKDLQWAFICTEDKRFYQHDGVDYKRTLYSFANMFLKISDSTQGGSTITQQLIKNVTQDKDVTIQRKVTEIYRALNLEKHYNKEDILEAYLNVIGLGNGTSGVQAAANMYFNKDVSKLTLAQSACLVAITNNPTAYDPYSEPEANKERQELVLWNMYDQGKIDKETYEAAIAEKLTFSKKTLTQTQEVWNYYVDQVVNDVADALVEEKGYTEDAAWEKLYSGGYRIYTPMNVRIQKICEDFYSDPSNFSSLVKKNGVTQQSAMVILDMQGRMVAVVGGIGEKSGSRVLNRATMSYRQVGSAMKPIGAYGPGIEYNLIHFSSMVKDSPYTSDSSGKWPSNWYRYYLNRDVTVEYALEQSINTVAVKVCAMVTPKASFDFVTTHLGLPLISYYESNGKVFSDIGVAPMGIGALTKGVTPAQLCASYVPFANGGNYYKPTTFSKILDPDGNTVLEQEPKGTVAFSSDTATVMNHLLQNCVSGPHPISTRYAKMSGWQVMGKTGTTDDMSDLWFVGATPYYCGAVWFGYDQPSVQPTTSYPPKVWQQIMTKVHSTLDKKTFVDDKTVVKKKYCLKTGLLATAACKDTAVGYYRKSNVPKTCTACGGTAEVASTTVESSGTSQSSESSSTAESSSSSTSNNG